MGSNRLVFSISLILLVAPAAAVAQQEQITVHLEYDEYVPGETITISGTVT